MQERVRKATKDHEQYEAQLSEFADHDVYRFRNNSGTNVKIAVKTFDLLN